MGEPGKPDLVIGYESVQQRPTRPGGGLYPKAGDVIGAGPAHAVRSGEQESVCGRRMRKTNGPPRSAGMMGACPKCREVLADTGH